MKRVSDDVENLNPIQELKHFFEWVNSQPENTPFKSIKLATVQYCSKLPKLESYIATRDTSLHNDFSSILQELSQQNEQLSASLLKIESELMQKSEGLLKLQEKIEHLNSELLEKDRELNLSKNLSENLQFTLSKAESTQKHLNEDKIIQLFTEVERKSYEMSLITTENRRLEKSVEQLQISNTSYLGIIEHLKKKLSHTKYEESRESGKNSQRSNSESSYKLEELIANSFDEKRRNKRFLESRNKPALGKSKRTASNRVSAAEDFIAYSSCLASAVEALINR